MIEIWKDILGYEGLYQVSNFGRVKSLERIDYLGHHRKEKILKIQKTDKRYYRVGLTDKNKKRKIFFVHRLVAEAFIPNSYNLPFINHKDENPSNNIYTNLEWCTQLYNNCYGNRIEKVIEKQSKPVLQYDLNGNLIKEWKSLHEAEKFGYDRCSIKRCNKGERKTHKGSIWKY